MHKLGSVFFMWKGQMAERLHSPRTWFSLLVLLVVAFMNAKSYLHFLSVNELYAHAGESLYYFLSGGFGNIIMTGALFLVMMSEFPRRAAWQNGMLVRGSRYAWGWAQIAFCFFVTALTILLLEGFCFLLTCQSLTAGGGWSDAERIAQDEEAAWCVQITGEYIREISPLRACLLSNAVLFFFLFTMSLVLTFCTMQGRSGLGLMLYTSVLVLQVTIMGELLPEAWRWMPAFFATLNGIAARFPEEELSAVQKTLCVYVGIDTLLIFPILCKCKRIDFLFIERDEA